jgi:hypothetical protein
MFHYPPQAKQEGNLLKKGMKIFHPPVHRTNWVSLTLSATNHQLSLKPAMELGQIFLHSLLLGCNLETNATF